MQASIRGSPFLTAPTMTQPRLPSLYTAGMASSDPSGILQVGFGFWASKVLLTGVELEVFTVLGDRAMTGEDLGARLGLHPRGVRDFFDTLLALGFLERDGSGPGARYRNTEATANHLDKSRPTYIGGILEMLNTRLYRYWDDLPEALRTGKPQNEIKHNRKPVFEELYDDLPRLEQFMAAMAGLSLANFEAFAEKFDFSAYDALPEGGAFVAIENLIDDDRRENAFGLLMSLNMLIEFGDAFDFTGAEFGEWCKEAGFRSCEVLHLHGPCSAAIARK